MFRKKIGFISLSTFVAGSLFMLADLPRAQAGACSLGTLQGEYLFTGRGDRATGVVETNFPKIFAGVYTFNGDGTMSALTSLSFGGEIHRWGTFTATYTLNPDCTGTVHFVEANTSWDLWVMRDGSEGNLIRTDEPNIATRSFKKMGAVTSCSVATMNGDYLFTHRGESSLAGPGTNVFVGVYTFDGNGNYSLVATRSLNGVIGSRITGEGSYTLEPNCTGTIESIVGIPYFDIFFDRDGSGGQLHANR